MKKKRRKGTPAARATHFILTKILQHFTQSRKSLESLNPSYDISLFCQKISIDFLRVRRRTIIYKSEKYLFLKKEDLRLK